MLVTHQPSSKMFDLFVSVVYFPGPIANSVNKMWFGGGKTLAVPIQCNLIVKQALGKEQHALCACTHELHSVSFVT